MASAYEGALGAGILSNPTGFMPQNQQTNNLIGNVYQSSPLGGQTSLGGAGYQAYMVPGSLSQKKFTPTSLFKKNVAVTDQTPTPDVSVGQSGNVTTPALGSTIQESNTQTDGQGIKKNKGNQSLIQRMNTSSSDQWDNFTGQGIYDKSNKANLDAQGNLKAKNALGFGDKLNAGMTLASLIGNAFDRQ